jgi:hypothetical protein
VIAPRLAARAAFGALVALAGLSALPACSHELPTASADVATDDLSADVTVVEADGHATLEVVLSGPGPRVDLAPGERLVVHATTTAGAASVIELTVEPGREGSAWRADLPEFKGDLSLELIRTTDRGVDAAKLPVPPSFTVTAPSAPVSRGAPLPLSWSDPGADYEVLLDVRGTCASWTHALSVDVGSYAIQAGLLVAPAGAPATCTLTITITRRVLSESSFGGPGRLRLSARRVRTVQVESTP